MIPNDMPEETKWVIDNVVGHSFLKLEILDFINSKVDISLSKDDIEKKVIHNSSEKVEFETALLDFIQSKILIEDSNTSTYKLTEDISIRNKLKQFLEYKNSATYNCLKILCRMIQCKDTIAEAENPPKT